MGIIRPLFQLNYWFRFDAVPFIGWGKIVILMVFGLLTIGCVVCLFMAYFSARKRAPFEKWFDKPWRKALRKMAGLFGTMACFGFVFYWFVEHGVPFLSMRFFFLLWVIVFIFWARMTWKYIQREIYFARASSALRHDYEKWLPKPRK